MFEFKLPDLGEGVHEGQVVNILVNEGDPIAEYQPMMEVETDKAAVEIPAPRGGRVAKVHVSAGQTVKVGQVLISIDDSGNGQPATQETQAPARAEKPQPQRAAAPAKGRKPAPKQEEEDADTEPVGESEEVAEAEMEAKEHAEPEAPRRAPAKPAAPKAPLKPAPTVARREGPVAAAPAVRKFARELGVDIDTVAGTGPNDRILRGDVERAAKGEPAAEPVSGDVDRGAPLPAVDASLPDFSAHGPTRREAVPQIRKTIARQMTRAWLNVPRVTQVDTADVTELDRNRKQLNTGLREGQPKLTMTAIVIKAVAAALREFPVVNASYDAASEEIIYKDYVHIGIAVDTPRGLVVPVLRDADKKPLPQIAADLAAIANNARTMKFEIKDLRGATFSITNYGALGGRYGTPMVNFPEAAILGLGRAKFEAVVMDNQQIVPRLILPLSMSFDHRIVDGADAARFLNDVIRSLENPLRLISL